MSRIDKSISVVVPVYNAENTIYELINRLKRTLNNFNQYAIVLVNDNSHDRSFEMISEYANNDSSIIAIDLGKNVGQQKSTFLGLQYAKGDYTVIIDDDLAQKPEDILLLHNEIEKGYDVVYALRKQTNNASLVRNLGSKIRDIMFDAITKKPKSIKVCSFRIISESLRKRILAANTDFIYISMEILRHTSNIGNIQVNYALGGPSNYSFKKLMSLITNMYIYYSKQKLIKTKPLNMNTYEIIKIVNGEKT